MWVLILADRHLTWYSISHLVIHSGRSWVRKGRNLETCKYTSVAEQIWVEKSKYSTVTLGSSTTIQNLFLQSCPWVALAGSIISWRDILTLAHTGLGAAWAGMLVFDSLVFCMTLYKSIILPRPNGVSILHILLRDGEFCLLKSWFSSFLIKYLGAIYFG